MENLRKIELIRAFLWVAIAASSLLLPTATYAQTETCPNYWVNPKTGKTECLGVNNGSLIVNPQQNLNSTQTVFVYGRRTCGWTIQMVQDLSSLNIPFQFKDVDLDETDLEMWNILRSSGNYSNNINLPVVLVNGRVMVRPSIEEVNDAKN